MRNLFIVFVLAFVSISASAQKLPNVQKESVWAPANVHIDGKAAEWGAFKAYNKATGLFYTIANDNENLYLLIQATNSDVTTKLIHSGVSLVISNKEKSDKGGISVTYPAYKKGELPLYLATDNQFKNIRDTVEMRMKKDSFINEKNKQLASRLKYIAIKRIQLTDSLISINNNEKILTSSNLNDKLFCTCEWSIPLKVLGLNAEKEAPFYYHIILNGLTGNSKGVNIVETAHGERIIYTAADGKEYVLASGGSSGMALAFPTDFWAEYTLAKK